MSTKEKVIRKSQGIISKRINEIKHIVFEHHLSKMLEVEKDAIETAKKMIKDGKDATQYLNEKSKERDRLHKLAKQSCNSSKLIDQLVQLKSELKDLNNELWAIERAKKDRRK